MHGLFPENPVLFYPSLAKRFGAEEAILLSIYHLYAQSHGNITGEGASYFLCRRAEWLQLAEFWDESELSRITASLVEQGVIETLFNANGSVQVSFSLHVPAELGKKAALRPAKAAPAARGSARAAVEKRLSRLANRPRTPATGVPRVVPVSRFSPAGTPSASLPVSKVQVSEEVVSAPGSRDRCVATTLSQRGPAPSFGGSTGWARKPDDLQKLFAEQETQRRLLHEISPDWRPNSTTCQMLAKQGIPEAFFNDKVDEFVAYWLEQNRKEASWDPLFLKRVKREWVKQQTQNGREARNAQSSVEVQGERHSSDNRAETRQRITDAVMDIHNTDW